MGFHYRKKPKTVIKPLQKDFLTVLNLCNHYRAKNHYRPLNQTFTTRPSLLYRTSVIIIEPIIIIVTLQQSFPCFIIQPNSIRVMPCCICTTFIDLGIYLVMLYHTTEQYQSHFKGICPFVSVLYCCISTTVIDLRMCCPVVSVPVLQTWGCVAPCCICTSVIDLRMCCPVVSVPLL